MALRIYCLALVALLMGPPGAHAQSNVVPCVPITNGGCAPAVTGAVTGSGASSLVIKAAPGVLYSAYATNLTSTAGFLVILNLAAAPGDGAIAPLDCVALPANGTASIFYGIGPGGIYSTGITAVVTSATTCFTKTTGTITAFIRGSAP